MAASAIAPVMGLTTTATPSTKGRLAVATPLCNATAEASAAKVSWPALNRSDCRLGQVAVGGVAPPLVQHPLAAGAAHDEAAFGHRGEEGVAGSPPD